MTEAPKTAQAEYPTEPMQPPYVPVVVDDVLLVFPARVQHLMPAQATESTDGLPDPDHWLGLLESLMWHGVSADAQLLPREGVEPETAWRHLRALAGSYQPKHEHKARAFVLLCEAWWEWALWRDAKGGLHTAGQVPDEVLASY